MRLTLAAPASLALLLTACGTKWDPRDQDGDGLSPAEGDCWDLAEGPDGSDLAGSDIYPGATDEPGDGFDADCAGNDDYDLDGDGWVEDEADVGQTTFGVPDSGDHLGAGDCWDDPADTVAPTDGFDELSAGDANPGVSAESDLWYDGYDADCSGNSDFDQDADDFLSSVYDGETTFPGSVEDEMVGGDCDDGDANINPDAQEVCDRDGIDEDCDALVNGDDDSVDLSTALDWYADADDDDYGNPDVVEANCDQPDGFVADNTDCDDDVQTTNPGADEYCDGVDNDCDDEEDEDDAVDAPTWFVDADGDGYGEIGSEFRACEQPAASSDVGEDCDDDAFEVNPDATEICDADNTDEDCNNLADDLDPDVDDAGKSTFYADTDGDGYGDIDQPTDTCDLPANHVENDDDCNDLDNAINPAATEICDASDTDEDCDGLADDADGSVSPAGYSTFYADDDTDGYGDSTDPTDACDAPTGTVTDDTDCDDSDININPGATEICDSSNEDEDCDGVSDDDDSSVDASTYNTYYADADADGFGALASTSLACDRPSDTVTNSNDCDDDASTCTTNCTNDADSDGIANCYDACRDNDGDDYGTTNTFAENCLDASGASCVLDAVCDGTDCDDTNTNINPGTAEVCDASNTDEDCNGLADNADSGATGTTTYYADTDTDGFGDATNTVALCDLTSGYVADDNDCDDSDININPDADEVCNDGDDNDCDGTLGDRDAAAGYAECEYSDADITDIAHATYNSADNDSKLGRAVRMVGDLDGDGVADVVAGAPNHDGASVNAGSIYVLTNLDSLTIDYDVSLSFNTNLVGAEYTGAAVNDFAGKALAGGDIDGDGSADLFVGAPGVNKPGAGAADRGAVYLLLSSNDWTADDTLIGAGSRGYGLGQYDELGAALSAEGDTDGDGDMDLLAGAPGTSQSEDGYALLLTSTTYQASGLTQSQALRYDARMLGGGAEAAGSGVQLADLDGDGVADAIIGAPEALVATVSAGRGYFVQGPMSGDITLSGEASMPGPTTGNGGVGGDAGLSVGTGDVNGDGTTDAIIGARGASSAGGAVYVLLGGSSFFPGTSSMTADATLTGSSSEQAGFSVAGAGDTDGDGYGEVIVGARAANSDAGAAYLAYGPISTGTIALASASTVAQLDGASAGDETGYSVHGGQDADGDGFSDFGVGAPETGSDAGTAYLMLGLGQ